MRESWNSPCSHDTGKLKKHLLKMEAIMIAAVVIAEFILPILD
jgi:hypothetical protein|tara:strand:+ start:12245 stop:12373 length:129 start_codon:yes stop_codon:yes gene_type:complete